MDSIKGKKILFVITKSNWGGAQAYVYTLARHYASQGAEVAVALGGTGEPGAPTGLLAERLEAVPVRTIHLSSFARNVSLAREFSAFSELRTIIKNEHPDIVHLNSSKAGGLGALAARLEKVKKIVFTAHGWAFREPRLFISRMLIWASSWCTVLLSHKVIVVSQLDYDTSPVFFSHNKIVTVRNGIAPFELKSRDEARAELAKISRKDAVLAYSTWIVIQSELHKNKGIDVAIRAFAPIAKSQNNCTLVVLGEGEERSTLEKLITELSLSDRVFLLGFVPNSKTYLHAASFFLLPSRKEGLPLTLLEAGIAGLPSIATRTGGIPEILTDGENGLLVKAENTSGLQIAIQKYLDDSVFAEKMGENLKEKVTRDFSEEQMFSETTKVYLG